MELLHALPDLAAARRRLRKRLLLAAPRVRLNLGDIPHSFAVGDLVAVAQKTIKRSDTLDDDSRFELLATTGRTLILAGRHEEGLELLRRGKAEATTEPYQTRFPWFIAALYYIPRREYESAREELHGALKKTHAGRTYRALLHITNAKAYRGLGSPSRAVDACHAAINMRVKEVAPWAYLWAGWALCSTSPDEARQMNRKSRELFLELDDERGVLLADANLASMWVENNEGRKAIHLLDGTRAKFNQLLDVRNLARAYNNYGAALRQLGQYKEATAAYLTGARYHVETENWADAVGTLTNLAQCYTYMRNPAQAFALYYEIAAMAQKRQFAAQEFRALAYVLELIAKTGTQVDAVPHVLSRMWGLYETADRDLTHRDLSALPRTIAQLGLKGAELPSQKVVAKPAGFPDPRAMQAVRAMLDEHLRPTLQPVLVQALQRHARRCWPQTDDLAGFLMGWSGRWFGNSDYQMEFLINQEAAKYHLRGLRDERVIAQEGIRKGARYHLAFHLTQERGSKK